MSAGHVYVIAFSGGTVKVGQTQNLVSRMAVHKASARNFGQTVTAFWTSPLHTEWLDNEEALKAAASELGGVPVSSEYFSGVDFAALTERARELPFTVPDLPQPEPSPKVTLRLRTAQFMEHTGLLGLNTESEIADHTGLDRSTLNRLLRGAIAPGNRIIGALLTTFPGRQFSDFFEVVQELEAA
jgi:hypothetical protein